MRTIVIGRWSFRPFENQNGHGTGYSIYPKGERSQWAYRGTLSPASDGRCFIISVVGKPYDARDSLQGALDLAVQHLGGA